MTNSVHAVMAARVDPNLYREKWTQSSSHGLQDIQGNSIRYPSTLERRLLEAADKHPSFDGDPRVVRAEVALQQGYKIKESESPLVIFRGGKNEKDLQILKDVAKHLTPRQYQKQYEKIVEAEFYNGSQIKSGPGFTPFVNDFRSPATAEQAQQIALLEKMADKAGIDIKHFGVSRYYSPGDDTIHLPTRDHFSSPNAYMKTLAHEMIHATMAKNHPGDPTDSPRIPGIARANAFADHNYALEEWRADLGALRLLDTIGVKVDAEEVRNSARYLESWSRDMHGKPLTVDERQKQIDQSMEAANYLLAGMDMKVAPNPEQEKAIAEINADHEKLRQAMLHGPPAPDVAPVKQETGATESPKAPDQPVQTPPANDPLRAPAAAAGPSELFDHMVASMETGDDAKFKQSIATVADSDFNRDFREQAATAVDAQEKQAAMEAQSHQPQAEQMEAQTRQVRGPSM